MLSRTFDRFVAYRRPFIVVAHALLFALAYVLAFGFRFEFDLGASGAEWLWLTLPVAVLLQLGAFWAFHLYEGLWRYVGLRDVLEVIKAVTLASAAFTVGVLLLISPGFPRSILPLSWLLTMGFAGGIRIGARLLLERTDDHSGPAMNGDRPRVLVAGAGDLAEALVRELSRGRLGLKVVGLLDDDPRKRGRRLHGIPVAGRIDDLPRLCAESRVDEVLIALPEARDKRRVAEHCRTAGVRVKVVPRLHDLLQGRALIEHLRDVDHSELIGRASADVDVEALRAELCGRRVLVTGAAGSIGSELARQIAGYGPELLVLLDRDESGLYFTSLELQERFGDLRLQTIVGDILDSSLIHRIFRDHAPELVYHAAAYKHVPLMEDQPVEAISNNVFGTEVLARAAADADVDKFVLISTDKAVQPVSVMGATKRAAEQLVASLVGEGTAFVSVRFGNVLGSDGSVVPLFQRQIANGGPLTVTDPDATRYFMLVSEAVELVLEAGRMGQMGDIFVLDMGEPIRIGDLADNLVRLAGLEPELDVPVRVTGLRPGERMHEHLPVADAEEVRANGHDSILSVRGPRTDPAWFLGELEILRNRVGQGDDQAALAQLRRMVSVRRSELSAAVDAS